MQSSPNSPATLWSGNQEPPGRSPNAWLREAGVSIRTIAESNKLKAQEHSAKNAVKARAKLAEMRKDYFAC